MMPLSTPAAPELAERDRHIARVQAAVHAWQPYLEGRSTGRPDTAYRAAEDAPRLDQLSLLFGLDPLEADIVATLWVLSFMPGWRAAIAALDAGRTDVTALAVSRLHGHEPKPRLSSRSPLLSWQIVIEHPVTSCANPGLSLDAQVLAWLEGAHEVDRHLVPFVRSIDRAETLASWPVARAVAAVRAAHAMGERIRVQLLGRDATAAAACAVAIAAEAGLPVMAVTPKWTDGDGRQLFIRVQRQAFLDGCAVLWLHAADRGLPSHVASFPLQFTFSQTPDAATWPGTTDHVVDLAAPTADERRALWLAALPAARAWPPGAVDHLAQRYSAQPADIAMVAATRPSSPEEAAARLLMRARGELGALAQRIDTPFVWDDLVVPPRVADLLRDIAFEASDRVGFWEREPATRLFPQGRGLVALFCGPPGTGKTMAAQVIAGELGLDLYRVDLSAVVSKWVGETSQNIQAVLTRAADRNLALFFDEAEAVYGRRPEEIRDAQDRFSGMDLSHLMVAIESYSGIVLLASNIKANIDPAFIRRIRYCVEFPKPDRAARRTIWGRVAEGIWGRETAVLLAPALDALSDPDTTGAQIKNASLSAAFAARRLGGITRALLAQALGRELAKDGQGVSERVLAQLAGVTPVEARR